MRRSKAFGLAALALIVAGAAVADEAAVKYRQNNMKAIGGHTQSIVALVKGEVSFNDQLEAHARALAETTAFTKAVFEKEAMIDDSTASPEIWKNWDDFAAAADEMQLAAEEIAAAAAAGDQGALRKGVVRLGRSCKSCHDDFRVE